VSTTTHTTVDHDFDATGRAGVVTLLRSEWTKLRSVRSTWISLLIIVVGGIGFAALFSWVFANHWAQAGVADRSQFDPVRISQAGDFITEIVVGVLGALVITAEYSTGSIRTTIASVPHRRSIAAAKALVLGALLFVVTQIVAFISFFVSQAVLLATGGHQVPAGQSILAQVHSSSVPVLSITEAGVAPAIFRAALFLTLMGLLALGFGLIVRNTAGTIALYVVLILVVPLLIQLLPSSIRDHIQPYLPSNLGTAMASKAQEHTDFAGSLLAPWTAALFSVLYVAISLAVGTTLLSRRDA
jgi:ABC-type transport system involved in multi-copper enzyme maturation permease subunit